MLNSGSASLSLSFAGLSALATKTFDRSENSFLAFCVPARTPEGHPVTVDQDRL
jgi:hypothetical protein